MRAQRRWHTAEAASEEEANKAAQAVEGPTAASALLDRLGPVAAEPLGIVMPAGAGAAPACRENTSQKQLVKALRVAGLAAARRHRRIGLLSFP